MNLASLILFGAINVAMVVVHLLNKSRIYEFPFWVGVISLGWFYPQAIGGYHNASSFPEGAYANGMLFATLCIAGLWMGFGQIAHKPPERPSWLDAAFDTNKLFVSGALLCVCGFFFQYKLLTLPESVLSQSQWSGAAVKYLFLASIFVFGFITLWLLYLSQPKLVVPKLLLFIVPSLLLLLQAAVLRGRRAAMMNLVAYVFVSAWFVRRITLPRWMLIAGLSLGLVLINAIGTYRAIMDDRQMSLSERLSQVSKADFTSPTSSVLEQSGGEFSNYIFYRQIYAEEGKYDFGLVHWNGFIFNFVPAQLVGRAVKNALMIPIEDNSMQLAETRYGHVFGTGTTSTGFTDAFASFGWFGFIKFLLIGRIMGCLYRRAMLGSFLGQMLYVYALGSAMESVTHGTHAILVSIWLYFLLLAYPLIHFSRATPEAATA